MDFLDKLFIAEVKRLFKDELKEVLKEALRELDLERVSELGQPSNVVLLDRKSAAKMLAISLPTLDYYTKQGVITGRRIGRKVLYREDELLNAGKAITQIKYKRRDYV